MNAGNLVQFLAVFAGFVVTAWLVRWTVGRDVCGPVAAPESEDV